MELVTVEVKDLEIGQAAEVVPHLTKLVTLGKMSVYTWVRLKLKHGKKDRE